MRKLLYTVLWVVGLMGTLTIWVVNAANTSCWEWLWTPPTTTYATWIVYGCDGNIPIVTIYWEDGKWITIKAMNEWATVISFSWNDTNSFWNTYQRWNNYPFPSTADTTTPIVSCDTAISAEWYGPWSPLWYYNSGTWIKESKRDSSDNRNLWWGSWDEKNLNWFRWFDTGNFEVINSEGRQAMCPSGYHIPSIWERNTLVYLWWINYDKNQETNLFTGRNLNDLNSNFNLNWEWTKFSEDLLIPFAWYYGSTHRTSWYGNAYRSSSPRDNDGCSRFFELGSNALDTNYWLQFYRSYGETVRCFKNSYIEPTKILNLHFISDGVEVWSGTVIENMTWTTSEEASTTTKSGYTLDYRYLSWTDTEFNFTTTIITTEMANESGNVYFIAKWTPIEYKIDYKLDGWTNSPNNVTWYTIESNITFENPRKDWYSFDGWFLDTWFTNQITEITQWSTWNITLYAKWTKIETKPSWSSSGWGGSRNKTDTDTQDSSAMPQNDKKTENVIQSETKWSEESSNTPMDSSDKSSEWQEILSPSDSSFTKEQKEAYNFAYKNWITTMSTIQKADMSWKLTRIQMAKMLSYYAINVLWQKPDETRINKFNDISEKLDAQYDSGVTLAYQLWIMWINMPNNKFRPNDEVTRAEFATALSRMLYNTSDWEYKSTPKYFIHHMEKLVKEWIITNDNPKMKELRGYVMIMLMRSAK